MKELRPVQEIKSFTNLKPFKRKLGFALAILGLASLTVPSIQAQVESTELDGTSITSTREVHGFIQDPTARYSENLGPASRFFRYHQCGDEFSEDPAEIIPSDRTVFIDWAQSSYVVDGGTIVNMVFRRTDFGPVSGQCDNP